MNEENLPPEDSSPPRAEPLSEAKESQINRMAGCTKMGGCLLLVLLIIGLVTWLFPLMLVVGQKTHNQVDKATMKDIQVAVGHYRTEHNRFPLPVSAQEKSLDVTVQSKGRWLDALLNNEPELNPRKIKFLDLPQATNGQFGLFKKEGETLLVDRWGKPYVVIFDTDLDNTIANPEAKPGNLSPTVPEKINATIAIYSGGPDGNLGTWEDNICTWR